MKIRMLNFVKFIIVVEVLGALAGCKSTSPYKDILQAAETKRENTRQVLHRMNIEQLHQELSKESERGLEPFNSMTFREVVSRGETAAVGLLPLLKKPDRSSLLTLLALRKINPTAYGTISNQFRLLVLTDSLSKSKYFNTWGLPHVKLEEAARAITEEGQAAVTALKPLLSEKRAAPVWGSEDFAEYQRFQYRVCDYAMALTYEAKGQKISIPVASQERDKLIEELIRN